MKATKGSHCIRRKRTKAGMRCAAFGKGRKGGKRRGKKAVHGLSDAMSGAVGQCRRYKRVTIKKGKMRGKVAMRCALYAHGPGYPGKAWRKKIGVKRPTSERSLAKREAKARMGRRAKNVIRYIPKAA